MIEDGAFDRCPRCSSADPATCRVVERRGLFAILCDDPWHAPVATPEATTPEDER